MGCMHTYPIWEEYLWPSGYYEFVCVWFVDFRAFCVTHEPVMPYIYLLLGGFPIELLHSILFWFNFPSTLVLLILPNIFILLFYVLEPNLHTPARRPQIPPFILLRAVDFYIRQYDLVKQISKLWQMTPWVHQYGALHQVGCVLDYFWVFPAPFPVWPGWLTLLFRVLISPWSCDIVLVSAAMSTSLDARYLMYYATWDVSDALA